MSVIKYNDSERKIIGERKRWWRRRRIKRTKIRK